MDDLVPVPGMPELRADPITAKVIAGRLERGETTREELLAIHDEMEKKANGPSGPER